MDKRKYPLIPLARQKVLFYILIALIVLICSACSEEQIELRTKASDGTSIILLKSEQEAQLFKKGDSVIVRKLDDQPWEIVFLGYIQRDTSYLCSHKFLSAVEPFDTIYSTYIARYKNVVIEDIVK